MSTEDEIVDLKAQIKSISSLYDILVENNTKLRNEKATLQQIVLDFQSRYHGSLEQIEELKAKNSELHSDSLEDHQEYKRYTYQIIKYLRAENARYREALERIDSECSRDDTVAWKIAGDALEDLQ